MWVKMEYKNSQYNIINVHWVQCILLVVYFMKLGNNSLSKNYDTCDSVRNKISTGKILWWV